MLGIRVCFINPNPSAPTVLHFDDIDRWVTDHGELHIFRHRDPDHQPSVIFAAKAWVWVENLADADGQEKRGPEPTRRDRHFPREDDDRHDTRHDTRSDARPVGRSSYRKSTVSDLSYPDAESIERTRAASVQFAIDGMTVPWSEAHMRKVKEYEIAVAEEFGPEAVDKLPWNQIPRGEDARSRM